ncbi:MAG TPA: hypothetical protein VF688_04510 [Allosphingosinicella sp.]|jgi:hypothetical protein
MNEDEIAAVHEAAHAVFAASGTWTRIHGPVTLKPHGSGDIRMSTDVVAISDSMRSDPRFDRNLPRLQLVRALLAGPVAERMLIDRGRARLSEAAAVEAAEGDYENIIDQLDKLDPPRRDLLARLEREVREELERPAVWLTVERFAAVLLERRSMGAEEASAILREIAIDAGLSRPRSKPGRKEILPALVAAMAAAGVIWSVSGAGFLPGAVGGACVGGFVLGLAWSLRSPVAPPASRLSFRS